MARSPELENLETFALLWLGTDLNLADNYTEIQQKLRSVINHLLVFEREQECQQYIERALDEKIILIVSAENESSFVPCVHHLQQLVAIYLYDENRKTSQLQVQDFKKVSIFLINQAFGLPHRSMTIAQ